MKLTFFSEEGTRVFLKNSLVNLFLAALGLHCFAQAFSGCGEQSLLSNCDAWPSHCDGFSCCGAQALGTQASAVAMHGLSRSKARGIFPDQGQNPCLLHQQAGS